MTRRSRLWGVLLAATLGPVACAPARKQEPPKLAEVGASPIDEWNDAQEREFGLLVGYEILARHGSTRYVPEKGPADGSQPDPRALMLATARKRAAEPGLEHYLTGVLKKVAAQGARDEKALGRRGFKRDFVVFVVETDEAYSCATPGGLIFVTTGLLRALQSESELAFVLAGEVAHVDREHALDVARLHLHTSRNTVEKVLADPQVTQGMVRAVFRALVEQGLGRTRTLEADRLALLYLTAADYDSTAPGDALARLGALENDPIQGKVLHHTQPAAADRLAQLKNPLETLEAPYLDGTVGKEAYAHAVLAAREIAGPPEGEPDLDEGDDANFTEDDNPLDTPTPTPSPSE